MNPTETFILDIQSYQWWISVVLVGLVIHFAGSYLKPFLDKYVSWFVRSIHTSVVRHNRELRSRQLEILKQSEVKQVTLALSELRHRFLGLFYLGAAFLSVFVLSTLLKHPEKAYVITFAVIAFSAVIFFLMKSLRHWFDGIDDGDLLNDLDNWR